ncbi:hypothetical protein BXT86_04550 [candidate division WOR-3 bacterium 4484_100]|uniref:Phosphoesterase n=1 Tax=candidate division WOR-3 bacterium 4484_100 TaxID=1936077 RepID=A0A1V4QFQ6_UNCW3|nr:MAG: hypothetical protein BXT86_04550 [candidate division WOR-3 bacterium 4484_100]
MKLGVVSDSHSYIKNLNRAVEALNRLGAEVIIHLGDNYQDMEQIGGENFLRVPGVFSDYYQDKNIPNRLIKDFAGWRFLLTHTVDSHPNDLPDDIRPEELFAENRVDVVLYGHTHIPDIEKKGNIIFINPGHLRDTDKKGFPPSFCLIDVTPEMLKAEIHTLNNLEIFKEAIFEKK